jgi:hypothetical protein
MTYRIGWLCFYLIATMVLKGNDFAFYHMLWKFMVTKDINVRPLELSTITYWGLVNGNVLSIKVDW